MKKTSLYLATLLIILLSIFTSCSHQLKVGGFNGGQNINLRASTSQFDSKKGYSYIHFHSTSSFSIQFPSKSWDGTLEFFNSRGVWEAITGNRSVSSRSYGYTYNNKRYSQAILIRGKNNTTITGANKENAWKFKGGKIDVVGGGLSALLNYGVPSSVNANQFAYLFDGVSTIQQKDLEDLGYTQSVAKPQDLPTAEEIDAMDDSLFVEESNPSIRRRIVEDILLGISPVLTEDDYKSSIEEMFVEDANANANLNSKLNLKLKNSSSSSIKITNKKLIGSTKNNQNTQQLNLKLKANTQETQGGGYLTDDAIIESIDITLPNGKKAIAFVSNNKYIGDVLYYSELPEDGSDITKTEGYKFALEYAQSQLEAYSEICTLINDEQIVASLIEDFGADLSEYYNELLEYGIDISKYQDVDSAKIQGIGNNNIACKNFFDKVGDFFKNLGKDIGKGLDIYSAEYGEWKSYNIDPLLEKDGIHITQDRHELLGEYYQANNYHTGCTNTAFGMVAIYYEYPKLSYSYRDFEEDKVYDIGYKQVKSYLRGDKGQSEGEKRGARRALGYMMYAFGKEFEANYEESGTSTIDSKVEKKSKNFGYKADYKDKKASSLVKALENGNPVILNVISHGNGHATVADGVKYEKRNKVEKILGATKKSKEYKVKMLHIDLGYDRQAIGWYNVGDDLKSKGISDHLDKLLNICDIEPKDKSDRSYDYKFAFPREEDKAEIYQKPQQGQLGYGWFDTLRDHHDGEENEIVRFYKDERNPDFNRVPFVLGVSRGFPYWNLNGRYVCATASELVAYKNAQYWKQSKQNSYLPPRVVANNYDIDKWLLEHNYFKLKNSNIWFKGFKNIADAKKFYGDIMGLDGFSKEVEYVPIINDKGFLIGYYDGIWSNSMIQAPKKDLRNWIRITSANNFLILSDELLKNKMEHKDIEIEYAYVPDYLDYSDLYLGVDDSSSMFNSNSSKIEDIINNEIKWEKWTGKMIFPEPTRDYSIYQILLRAKNNTLIGSKDGGRWIVNLDLADRDKPVNVKIEGKIGCFIDYTDASLEYSDLTNSLSYKLNENSSYGSLDGFTKTFDEIIKKRAGVSAVRVYEGRIWSYSPTKRYYKDIGQTMQLSAEVDSKTPQDTRAQKVVWTSSNPSVAKVDENGFVTMLSAGDVTITAASIWDNSISDCVSIEVSNPEEVDIVARYSSSEDKIFTGQSVWHYFNVYTSSLNSPYSKRADYIIESSNSSIAEIKKLNSSGDYNVIGKSAGVAKIFIYHKDNRNIRYEYPVTVKKVNIKSFTLSENPLTLSVDGTASIRPDVTADVSPNEFARVYTDFTWVSSDPSVVDVDSRFGYVRAVSKGTATITATSLIDPTKSASCTITVK